MARRPAAGGRARSGEPGAFESSPEFEITDRSAGAIRYLEHGYPSPLVRWHCHNEYELHYIVASSGKAFVGDYIGEFRPGSLMLTGPRLPHNWISDVDAGERFELRDMVVHFEHRTVTGAAEHIPELREAVLSAVSSGRRIRPAGASYSWAPLIPIHDGMIVDMSHMKRMIAIVGLPELIEAIAAFLSWFTASIARGGAILGSEKPFKAI